MAHSLETNLQAKLQHLIMLSTPDIRESSNVKCKANTRDRLIV